MLAKRVFSALVALAIVLGAIFLAPPLVTLAVLVAIVALAAWEWGALLSARHPLARIAYAALVAALFVAAYRVTDAPATGRELLLAGACLFWMLALVLILRFPVTFAPAVVFVVGLVVLVPAFVALAHVFTGADGDVRLLLFLFVIWAADVGAYFVGRRFGRTRLAPSVSPGKSWEGVAGGLLVVALVAGAGARLIGLPIVGFVVLALVVALVSIVGDLTVSMFKRNAGVKDSGTLFPGHGGLLDRVDSICAGAPVFALALPYVAG